MISAKMTSALNEQINREMYSSYLYLAMSAHCRSEGLNGFAGWLGIQAREEYGHAMKILKFLEERGARVELKTIKAPPARFASPVKIFEDVLAHEKFITDSINDLMELAVKEKDFASQVELQWFVKEQVEEESVAADILNKLHLVGSDPRGLFMVDRELGARQGG